MADTVVPLSRSYEAHDKKFQDVVLRQPTYREMYMEGLGKPFDFQMTAHGPIQVTYPDVVDGYLQNIVLEPGYECLMGLDPLDAMKLERAVCDFFRVSTEPTKSQTGSYSGPGSTRKPSKKRRQTGSSSGPADTDRS